MSKKLILLVSFITIIFILTSCEFVLPKVIPLFVQLKDSYAWVTENASTTVIFYTNKDVNGCIVKINGDTITQPNVLTAQSTLLQYGGDLITAKEYIINISNYTKVSTNDLYFNLSINVKRGNESKELTKKIYFGKLIKKDYVDQNDIKSGYVVYQLYRPTHLQDLTITSTLIIKSTNTPILVEDGLSINGGTLIIQLLSGNSITIDASTDSWSGIKISNNGSFDYGKHKLYILNALNGIYLTSSNKDYEFSNITFNNKIGSSNTGIYNDSQSVVTISNSYFYNCGSPIKNYGRELYVNDCSFNYQLKSLEGYGKTVLNDCDFSNLSPKIAPITSAGTILTLSASPAIVSANDFTMKSCKIKGFTIGIYIHGTIKNLQLENNLFENDTIGIFVNSNITNNPNIWIKKNYLQGNVTKLSTPESLNSLNDLKDCGIVLNNCDGSILYENRVKNYSYGVAIFNNYQTQLHSSDNIGNDIIDSNVYTLGPLDLSHTYWGTLDSTSITKRINSPSEVIITPIATKSNYE